MKIVDKETIIRVANPLRKTTLYIVASSKKEISNNKVSRKLKEIGGFKSNIKKMVERTYTTIETFLKYTCDNTTPNFWTNPPNKNRPALLKGLNGYNPNWNKMQGGCKWFMKIPNIGTANQQTKLKIKRALYLTIVGLIDKELFIKPYAGRGDDGSVRAGAFNPNAPQNNSTNDHFDLFLGNYKKRLFKGKVLERKYVIHIGTNNITDRSQTNAVMSLVHEASHKFAGTEDQGYLYSRDEGVSKMSGSLKIGGYMARIRQQYQIKVNPDSDFESAPQDQLIWNAESIAALIYHYGN